MRIRSLLLLLASLALTAGCGAITGDPQPATADLTAEQVVAQLAERIPTASPGVVFTPETDPNEMMGRPGGYISKASFVDSRINPSDAINSEPGSGDLGGSVEVFPDEKTATVRREYLQAIATSGGPMFSEYTYQKGTVLVRVARALTPDQAAEYETALAEIG